MDGFNVRKAAQVAAYFALKSGGQVNVLKLVKLIYLSDRLSLERYDTPILYDAFVAMPHGPVNSLTLNHINGLMDDNKGWVDFITDKSKHQVSVSRADLSIDDLDELSEAEITLLSEIWSKFGRMSKYEIRDYTHTHCLEWEDPDGSSYPIPYERVLKFLGKPNADLISRAIQEDRHLLSAWQ